MVRALLATASLADRTPVPQGTWLAQLPEAKCLCDRADRPVPAGAAEIAVLVPSFDEQAVPGQYCACAMRAA